MVQVIEPEKNELRRRARALGFTQVRVAQASLDVNVKERYREWLLHGYHGEMSYLARTALIRTTPEKLLPGVRSVLVFQADYYPYTTSPPKSEDGIRVSKYALGIDYHHVLRQRLEKLLPWLSQTWPGHAWRIAVDSAPALERAYAVAAGIGFWGRNTMVITPHSGSYYFLALILTTAELEPDPPIWGTCGTCRRCLDACPTQAFVAPYVLDARRCISYLTIERRTPLSQEERTMLGQWIFGCDVCQDVCPYNRRPSPTPFEEFRTGVRLREFVPPELFLEPQSNREFAQRFGESPILRPGRRRIQELARWFVAKRENAFLSSEEA